MKLETKPMYIEEVPDLGRVIVVGDEVFDWGLDLLDIRKGVLIYGMDPVAYKRLIGNIQAHLVNCFSEFIGRKVSLDEIVQGIEEGQIAVNPEVTQ